MSILYNIIQEMFEQEYQLFVDLDGVLADFKHGVDQAMRRVHGNAVQHDEDRYEQDPKYRKLMWDTVGAYQNEHGGELWYELPLMHDAHVLWDYIREHNPQILTATGRSQHGAGNQKRRWVAKKLGPSVRVILTQTAREKSQHAKPNHILIDDKEKAIKPWVAAGGIGILHTSAENTVRQLRELGI